jgi:hypothetical protein
MSLDPRRDILRFIINKIYSFIFGKAMAFGISASSYNYTYYFVLCSDVTRHYPICRCAGEKFEDESRERQYCHHERVSISAASGVLSSVRRSSSCPSGS